MVGGSSRDENYFVEYSDFEVPPSLAQENPPSPIPSTMTGDLMRQPAEEPLAAGKSQISYLCETCRGGSATMVF